MTIQKIKPTKLVYGHGTNDLDEPVKVNGKPLKFYYIWKDMLNRCYSEKSLSKHPTYRGCSVCDEWLSLSTFRVWFDVNYRDNTELDKDILVKGNKVYGPEACRFVPQYINSLLLDAGAARGELPVGVRIDKRSRVNSYHAQCNNGYGRLLSGPYRPTIALAKADYARIKTEVVRQQAKRAVAEGMSLDVYYALIARGWHGDAT